MAFCTPVLPIHHMCPTYTSWCLNDSVLLYRADIWGTPVTHWVQFSIPGTPVSLDLMGHLLTTYVVGLSSYFLTDKEGGIISKFCGR